MDYSESFRLIQTSLNHCNEFVKKFDKINDYGGNEIYINEIVLKLKNIFLSQNYNDEESHEQRKINLFLILNTDVNFKYDLNHDYKICHLLNNFEKLSKCLYVNIMWQLKLEKYYYEAIKFSPPWFIFQFLDETVDSLRFSKSFDSIQQAKELTESIYENICRMDYRFFSHKNDQTIDQKIILSKFVDQIASLMRYYNTPCAEEEITKSKRKMKEYLGFSLNYQLTLVLSCFKMFERKPSFEIPEKYHIFKIMLEKEPEINNNSEKRYSASVTDTLLNINVILLNTLQNSILNITLDDFMYWVEIDIEDNFTEDVDLKRDNLQKSIGEQCYEVTDFISKNPHFEHDVIKQLSTIAIKPKTIAEIAKEASVGTVLDKIESSSSSRIIWLEELLGRPNILYFNDECLQTIIDNHDIIQLHHLLKVLRDHQNFSSMDSEDEAQIKEIFLKGGSRLNSIEKSELVNELIRVFGDDYSIFQDTDVMFEQETTNYLNKITEENIEEESMWNLILRYPQKFYEKLMEDVGSQDESQIATILKIIIETTSISSQYVKKIILNKIESSDENRDSLAHQFMSGIFKSHIMERKEFIKDVIMANFSRAISNNNHELLLMLLQTLKSISAHLKINDLLPPLITQISHILDKYRWDLVNYSSIREEIVDLSISIIQEMIKTILINGSTNDKEWIKSKINNCRLMTKFYFQKLSLVKGQCIIPFDLYLHPDGFENISKMKITSFLCETIIRCTMRECKRLMSNEVLFNFYAESLSIVAVIVRKSNQTIPLECFHKCITDYVKVLGDELSLGSYQQDSSLLTSIINLIKSFPVNLYEDLTILFLEPLKSFNQCENFINLISELEECELKRVFLLE